MNEICEEIKSFLKKYNLASNNLTYLVGFSGGFDSMCLLHALKKTAPKNRIIALHLNHNWRGEESDREEQNCISFCEQNGIEIYCEKLSPDVAHTETAAREARYEFFQKCCENFGSNIVFTAHNKNDNAETLLYRICTGTGISGLRGICENRGAYFRPLLNISRRDIEQYCKYNKLTPNNDSSNSNTDYKRNFIRAEVLPKLEKINPNVIDKINSLSEIAKEENEIVEEYLTNILEKISEEGKIQTKKFLKLSIAVQKRILYKIFTENHLEYDKSRILYILNFLQENSGSKSGKTCSLTDNLWIFINNDFIELIKDKKTELPYFQILHEGKYEDKNYVFEIKKFDKIVRKFPKDSEGIAYVDLKNFPFEFELRTRQYGDFIQPFGLNGTQKLKKYLNEKKVPNHKKDSLLFLTQDKEILWAINLGISDKIKVREKPTHIMRFYKKES